MPHTHVEPSLEQLRQLHAGGANLLPICRRVMSDQLTPVLAYRRLVKDDARDAPSFLLESVVGGDRIARYSFLGSQPVMRVTARGNHVCIENQDEATAARMYEAADPLRELPRLTERYRFAPPQALGKLDWPAFTGGWVGYAGYDTVRYLEGESLPSPPNDDRHLPDLEMQLYLDVVAFDQAQKCILVITHLHVEPGDDLAAAYEAGCERLDEMVHKLQTPLPTIAGQPEMPMGELDLHAPPPELPVSNLGEGGYEKAVEKAKEYIAAGDIFQVVPSQRFVLETGADPFDVYRALRVVNPSPYMFYLQIEGGMLVGSSPEILCHVQDGQVTNRPLAGTRHRGKTESEDKQLEEELVGDPKDRAEHIMLVDLARNDVGRVADPGSIALPEVLVVERYSHVMHLSSTVTGQLQEGLTCWDALQYSLPVGTVSGAPKVRAMQIIDELETVRRGPYAGAVGHVDLTGNMDMAIALRTMVVVPNQLPNRWQVHIQAGAGIVADSDPHLEHVETVNKAAAMAKAVALAEQSLKP